MKSREFFDVYVSHNPTNQRVRIGEARIDPMGRIDIRLDALPIDGRLWLVPAEETAFERETREAQYDPRRILERAAPAKKKKAKRR